jgi:hypothetical protein
VNAIPNIAELALETRLAARETAERRPKSAAQLAYACKLGSLDATLYRSELEVLAAEIGLSPDATGHVLGQWEYRARLLDEAHERLREQIPFEKQIRLVIKLMRWWCALTRWWRKLIPFEAQIQRMVSSQEAATAA